MSKARILAGVTAMTIMATMSEQMRLIRYMEKVQGYNNVIYIPQHKKPRTKAKKKRN